MRMAELHHPQWWWWWHLARYDSLRDQRSWWSHSRHLKEKDGEEVEEKGGVDGDVEELLAEGE
jgi:hypothetical protein